MSTRRRVLRRGAGRTSESMRTLADRHTHHGLDDPAVLRPAVAVADAEIQVPLAESAIDDREGLVVLPVEIADLPGGPQAVVGLDPDGGLLVERVSDLDRRLQGGRGALLGA